MLSWKCDYPTRSLRKRLRTLCILGWICFLKNYIPPFRNIPLPSVLEATCTDDMFPKIYMLNVDWPCQSLRRGQSECVYSLRNETLWRYIRVLKGGPNAESHFMYWFNTKLLSWLEKPVLNPGCSWWLNLLTKRTWLTWIDFPDPNRRQRWPRVVGLQQRSLVYIRALLASHPRLGQ